MKTNFAAIAALALAATGFAASADASDQLARSLGVAPGAYSTAELVQLRNAREQGDWTRVAFIESKVAPSAAAAEQAALKTAAEKDDVQRLAFLQGAGVTASRDAAAVSANAQLARAIGVAPGEFGSAALASGYLHATSLDRH
ncbi:hypothetical protein [Mangrovicoccus ximenensis]|uniref:hypothetical protein n=1 Tax=Mangrovicoccus ximenensis TaxID=1911570 RepID=UPI0011AE2F9A|nr:hypothetical protein [Mangrovicoccus ximenensis]